MVFLGIYELSTMFQYLLTVFFIVAVTNAFNLIDGIDGTRRRFGIYKYDYNWIRVCFSKSKE